MNLPLCLALLLLTGCAETKLSLGDANHPPTFGSGADARHLHLVLTRTQATLDVDDLNHSAPTRARGDNITKAGSAAAGVLSAAAAASLLP